MLSALAARGLPRIAGPRGELNDHLPPPLPPLAPPGGIHRTPWRFCMARRLPNGPHCRLSARADVGVVQSALVEARRPWAVGDDDATAEPAGFVPTWVGGGGSRGPHERARDGSDARWPDISMSWGGSAKISLIMECTHG